MSLVEIPKAVVVFDYAEPFQNYPAERRASVMAVAESAAARGEPWLTFFDPSKLRELLHGKGFKAIEDLGLLEITERLYSDLRRDITIGPGPHIVRASHHSRTLVPPVRRGTDRVRNLQERHR